MLSKIILHKSASIIIVIQAGDWVPVMLLAEGLAGTDCYVWRF